MFKLDTADTDPDIYFFWDRIWTFTIDGRKTNFAIFDFLYSDDWKGV